MCYLQTEQVTEILIGLCPFPTYIEYEEIAASMKTNLLSHQYTPLWCHNKDMQAGTTVSSGTQPIAGMYGYYAETPLVTCGRNFSYR